MSTVWPRRTFLRNTLLLTASSLVAACAPQTPASPVPAPGAPKQRAGTPRRGGNLVILVNEDAPHLDPNQTTSITTTCPSSVCFSTLMRIDPDKLPDRVLIGDLAESWDFADSGRTLVVKLRKGVVFHDGKPFTSADVKFTFDRIMSPPKGVSSGFQATMGNIVAQVEAADDHTVRFRLKQPANYLPGLLAQPTTSIVPKHIVSENQDVLKTNPIGTGPFMFDKWNKGVDILFKRFDRYFVSGRPYVDSVNFTIAAEDSARVSLVKTGRAHVISGSEGLSPQGVQALQATVPDLQIWKRGTATPFMLWMNTTKPPFNDIRVRQAVARVIDVNELIKLVWSGLGSAGGYVGPGQWSLPESVLKEWSPYAGPTDADVQKAKALMAEAGHANGLTVKYVEGARKDFSDTRVVVESQLAKIGIKLTVTQAQYPTVLLPELNKRNFDIAYGPILGDLYDPLILQAFTSKATDNPSGLADSEVDRLFAAVMASDDQAERKKLSDQLQVRLWELLPAVSLEHRTRLVVAVPSVAGMKGEGVMRDNFRRDEIWLTE